MKKTMSSLGFKRSMVLSRLSPKNGILTCNQKTSAAVEGGATS